VKIVIPGGTGQVGQLLARAFAAEDHEVVVLGRGTTPAVGRLVSWDGRTPGSWAAELDGADVVMNLAGRSVDCRYNDANRRAIIDSRVDSTRAVGEAIRTVARPPAVWLQASTATIYAHRFDAPNDEGTGIIGGDEPNAPDTWRFSFDVAKRWEAALEEVQTPQTRKVALRSAMTMSPDRGGIFDVLLGLVRRGLGGAAAGGRQFISWVHGDDFVSAVHWLIEHEDMEGPVNIAAPNPLPNADFMRELRRAWGTRIGLPSSRWMLEAGALLMRTETELVLKSRRVVPGRLLERGFEFGFPEWGAAADDLCAAWRRQHRG
jgi:uncharacterized protein (TIGR01777 family)